MNTIKDINDLISLFNINTKLISAKSLENGINGELLRNSSCEINSRCMSELKIWENEDDDVLINTFQTVLYNILENKKYYKKLILNF